MHDITCNRNKMLRYLIFIILINISTLSSTEFTVSSYNCGGLSNHYDYLRAVVMEKLMQERHNEEPIVMSLNEKIQRLALKILFTKDSEERALALEEWSLKKYDFIKKDLYSEPIIANSPNSIWYEKANQMITPYNIRPVVIHDEECQELLFSHLAFLLSDGPLDSTLQFMRTLMASNIFYHHLKHDIICLQEADYIDTALKSQTEFPFTIFPESYAVLFTDNAHSKNGIAWNKDRFEWMKSLGDILGRGFAIQLRDRQTGKIIVVASGHLTGCNPYEEIINPKTKKSDAEAGNNELKAIMDLLASQEADLMILGMDSNVTSLHPRLKILKKAKYQIDYENYLEPTCTSPYQILNNRIDWIAAKSNMKIHITNLPVLSVGLNNSRVNISDHKPIAAKIDY